MATNVLPKQVISMEAQLPGWSANITPSRFQQVQEVFNRHPKRTALRAFLLKGLRQSIHSKMSWQEKELAHYKMLNLLPRDAGLRQKLQGMMYAKHGGASKAQVTQAYRHLNDAFNTWDKGQISQALALFKKAQLPNSPELTAVLAYHLRDAGQVGEALKVLRAFKGGKGYLGWMQDMEKEILQAQKALQSKDPYTKVKAMVQLGQLKQAETLVNEWPDGDMKHWYMAKILERQGQYHPASQHYFKYYATKMKSKLPGYQAVVYKAQLEDLNSVALIAQKFRTSTDLIRQANEDYAHPWVDTYRMLIVPIRPHEMTWPTQGYVSSHFGYRLHPIRGTWRLHEGIDIETLEGVKAVSAHAGKVVARGYDKACGNMVRVQQTDQLNTVYCHGDKLIVPAHASVKPGQPLLITGNTGASASNHLHFGVKHQGQYVDPMDWL